MNGPLSVSDFVVVDVAVASGGQSAQTFNQGLIVGPSTVIPSYGANPLAPSIHFTRGDDRRRFRR